MALVTHTRLKPFDRQSWAWMKAEHLLTPETRCQGARIFNWVSVSLMAESRLAGNEMRNIIMAKDYVDKAIGINRRSALSNLGVIYEFMGLYHEAGGVFKEVLKNQEQYDKISIQNALNGLGNVEAKTGNPNKAKEYYKKALAINPNMEAAKKNLENLENQMQRIRK